MGSSIRTGTALQGSQPTEDQISLLRHATLVLRHRRLVFGLPAALALLTCVVVVLLPRTYTASTTFMPVTGTGLATRLSGIAAQFGLSVPGEDAGQSPSFYSVLITSDRVLRAVVQQRLPTGKPPGDDTSTTLVEYYGLGALDAPRGISRAVEELRSDFRASPNLKTGTVQARVTTHSPRLSAAVLSSAVELVNRFNQEQRKSQARAEREFVESRVGRAGEELRTAEDRLQAFMDRNRDYRNSPQLLFAHDRLQRSVDQRQQIFTALAQSLEQARIDEVRNTPLISVIEEPEPPAIPDRRRLLLKLFAAIALGLIAGLTLAYGHGHWVRASMDDPEAWTEFRQASSAVREDLRGLGTRAGRRGAR